MVDKLEGGKVGPTCFATWDNSVIIASGNKVAFTSLGGSGGEVMIVNCRFAVVVN